MNEGCCGLGRNHGKITCLPQQMPCRDRNRHIFWDAYHLTEAASLAAVKRLFDRNSSKFFTYPMTIRQLANYEPCLQFVKTEPGIEKSQTVDVKIPFSCSSFEIVVSRSSNKDRNIPIPLCFRARGPFRSMNKSFLKESNAFGNRLFADIWRLIVVVPLVNENNLAGPKTDLCL